MAKFYYSLQRGQETAVGDLVTATTSPTVGADVELMINTANNTTIMDAIEMLTTIKYYLQNLGLESQPGINLPAETISG